MGRRGNEATPIRVIAYEQTEDKHYKDKKLTPARKSCLADWLMRFFLVLLIISPKGHESQEELFLRYLLSLTSCNDFPTSDQLVQWIFVPQLLLKSPFPLSSTPLPVKDEAESDGGAEPGKPHTARGPWTCISWDTGGRSRVDPLHRASSTSFHSKHRYEGPQMSPQRPVFKASPF